MKTLDIPKPLGLPTDHWMNDWKMEFRTPPAGKLVVLVHKDGFAIAFPQVPEKENNPHRIIGLMSQAGTLFANNAILDAAEAKKTHTKN